MMDYTIYVADCETTSLDDRLGDIIEVSFHRLTDDVQKTWHIKPINSENIDPGSLKINGHKLDDLLHKTASGRELYKEPNSVIVEIENWVLEDNVPNTQRVLCGQNISFDKGFLEQLWIKCNSKGSYPFGRRTIDTMQIAFIIDYVEGNMSEGYSLNQLIKKYGIKNSKAHSAAADVCATKELFLKQIEYLRNKMNIK